MSSEISLPSTYRSLILGIYTRSSNPIFSEYAGEIQRRSEYCEYLNYRNIYLKLGPSKFEKYIGNFIEQKRVNHLFVLFSGWDFLLNINFLNTLSKRIKIVLFFFDSEYYFENLDRYYAQVADLVVTTDKYSCYDFEELNIPAYTSYALYDSINMYVKQENQEKKIDISFVGNLDVGYRREYIHYLVANGVEVEVYGAGSSTGFISHEKVVEIHNQSKICLNFTGMVDFKYLPPGIPLIRRQIRQSKGRPIEIALCGGFVLSEYSVGISGMFDIGSEIDLFYSKEELLKKVKYYLVNNSIRSEMANNAYVRAKTDYDLSKGFDKIFTRLNESKRRNLLIYVDRSFTVEYCFTHLKIALISLFSMNWMVSLAELKLVVTSKGVSLSRPLQELCYVLRRVYMRYFQKRNL